MARWDGKAFHLLAAPVGGTLTDVHVVSETESYACGHDGKVLRVGSGVEVHASHPRGLYRGIPLKTFQNLSRTAPVRWR